MNKGSAIPVAVISDPASDDVPEGWRLAPIKDTADVNPRHPKGVDDSMPVSFAPMAALSEDGPAFVDLQERLYGEVRKGFTHFGEGDVLFAKITPCMENGKGAVATGLRNNIGCGTTELHVLRPHAELEALYLYRFLSQQCIRRDAKETFTSSAGQARVPAQFIKDLEIPLPPIAEQKRIVAKVEELLARVNAARKGLAKVPAILKRFRQSVLAAACSGRLTEEWRGSNDSVNWRDISFQDLVVSSFYGPRFAADDYSDFGIPTIRTTDMDYRGRIDLSGSPRIRLAAEELVKLGLQDGDLLVTRTGATIGKCAVYAESLGPALPSAYLIRFRLKKELVDPRYGLMLLMAPEGQSLLRGGSTAVAQPNVNAKSIGSFEFSLPPLPEQCEIIRQVDRLFALADSIEKQVAAGTARGEKLTQAILAKAFRGELVPTEAELARREGHEVEPVDGAAIRLGL